MNTPRCRPGDLALVIKGLFAGSMVTTIELAPEELLREIGVIDRPVWRVDRFLDWGCGEDPDASRLPLAPDSALLPISPEPEPCEIEREESVPAPDLSDMDRIHRTIATDQLAEIFTRLAADSNGRADLSQRIALIEGSFK
jgi:hypothetical protein